MLKILHTADWHLGHQLYKNDRTTEQLSMLWQIHEIVRERKPDLLLICGDVFDTGQPSAAVQTMFADALLDIHNAHPEMTIIVTAGNHDSPSKHEIFRHPWARFNVRMIGYLDTANPADNVVEVPGKCLVGAIPYVFSHNLTEETTASLTEEIGKRNTGGLPVVLTAHAAVAGCDTTGHDNTTERNIGDIDAIPLSRFGSGYDYLALGHIHRSQNLDKERRARYSGTPLPVSFDERYNHTVSLVTIAEYGALPEIEEIHIHNPRHLVNIPATGFAPWEEVIEKLKALPDDEPSYVRLNVSVKKHLDPNAMHLAREAAKGKKCEICNINTRLDVEKGEEQEAPLGMDAEQLRSANPLDIARIMAQDIRKEGEAAVVGEFDADMEEMFAILCREVEEEALETNKGKETGKEETK